MKIKRISEFPLLHRIFLKFLHKVQVYALNNNHMGLYMLCFEKHFKSYFGLNLEDEVLNLSVEGKAAMRKHARLVVKTFYSNQKPESKKMMYKASASAFRDNMVLNIKL